MTIKSGIYIVASALLIAFITWQFKLFDSTMFSSAKKFSQTLTQTTLLDSEQKELIPDAYMKNASISSYNDKGALEYYLQTNLLKHYITDDKILLSQPILDYTQNGHYIATANNGTLFGRKNLLLNSNAKLIDRNSDLTLSSEALDIDLQNKTIKSDVLVSLRTSEGVTSGTGMLADMDNETFELKKGVRGIYEP